MTAESLSYGTPPKGVNSWFVRLLSYLVNHYPFRAVRALGAVFTGLIYCTSHCIEVTSACAENPTCDCTAACQIMCDDTDGNVGCYCVSC